MNFCLADGSSLTSDSDPKVAGDDGADPYGPTEAVGNAERRFAEMSTMVTPPPQFVRPPVSARTTNATSKVRPPSNNGNRILLVAIVILLASVAVLAYFLFQGKPNDSGVDAGAKQDNSNSPNANRIVSGSPSPTPNEASSPIESPSPSPTLSPAPNTSAARDEVLATMRLWADSLTNQDLNSNVRFYADQLDDYYGSRETKAGVRAKRQRNFEMYYSSTSVQLSNIIVEVDPTGTRATVSYDNDYDWRGGAKYLTGKSQNSMDLSKVGSQWLITSERHIKNYFENSN